MKTRDILENAIVIPSANLKADHPDHEVQMAKSDLYRAGKSAMELHTMLKGISERQGLEGWVQAKITKAADYLESVYHYLDYELRGQKSALDEQPITTTTTTAPGTVTTAPAGTTVAANPQQAAAAAQKAAQNRRKQIQDQIAAVRAEIAAKQKQMQELNKQLSQPVKVSESASAGASAAGGVATAVGATGFKSGGIGTKPVNVRHPKKKAQEAASPAQQAAIAVNMKKQGKKPKTDEADYKGWVSNPQAKMASNFMHDPDRAATVYKPNKYDPETGLGGYIANRARGSVEDQNIIIQLTKNLDAATAKPITLADGSKIKINVAIAKKVLNKLDAMKPVEKHETVKNIISSKDAFSSFVNSLKTDEAATNQLKGTDKPKKTQKPGVIDQPHPFKGKLVGGD